MADFPEQKMWQKLDIVNEPTAAALAFGEQFPPPHS